MTHKAQPYGYRLGITKDWRAHWFAKGGRKNRELIREDFLLRAFLRKELDKKMVSEIKIERERDSVVININTARPGLIIGKEGLGIEDLVKKTKTFARKNKLNEEINIRVEEVRHLETDAALVAETICEGLKKQMPHRRLMKQTVEKVMANKEVKGARVVIAGRLGGSEIARSEEIKQGKIPLQTLDADIDFALKPAIMSYGTLGIKVWIYKS